VSESAQRLNVVATAGHVDHGKSSLVLKLTGTDPDRFEEEKRRGLTIDLGFAWLTLPSGVEIGFVDVPGHERFVRNMLAGVGPVRLVLFVVAADEGWKPQSEEHLAIVDLLGVAGAVIALTKSDIVDAETLARADAEVATRLRGSALEGAPIVTCSSVTGQGLDELVKALDAMVTSAPEVLPGATRPRQFVDRVFSIKGAGTVVTGTLSGGPLAVGDEVELYPTGARSRIRGLQSHKRAIERALPVSRVAVNLAGTDREDMNRGDVLALPGQWRATTVFEARVRPIRGLGRLLTSRGAYKLYAGAAERDARIRFLTDPASPDGAFARISIREPLVLDVFDRFVLREAGRHATVAGGRVLDIAPPLRPGASAPQRLTARENAERAQLPALLVAERGAVRVSDVLALTGSRDDEATGYVRTGDWLVSDALHSEVTSAIADALERFHLDNPLRAGADLGVVRTAASDLLTHHRAPADPGLVQGIIDALLGSAVITRSGNEIGLASHSVVAGSPDMDRLVRDVAENEATPPTVTELQARGFSRDLIDASVRSDALVRVSKDLVMTAGFVELAESALRTLPEITVSAFREKIGTSRKYAIPLLEYFDRQGITLRRGDVRVLR
jgi:selenocysteine-specific elongation factor